MTTADVNVMQSTVVLDPGHGGSQQRGTVTPDGARFDDGLTEKEVNYALAQSVARHLGAGRLTRGQNEARSHLERIEVARLGGAQAFVSLHTSAGTGRDEVFCHPGASPRSRQLAEAIHAQLSPVLGGHAGRVSSGPMAVLSPEHHDPGTAACLLDLDYYAGQRRAALSDPRAIDHAGAAIARGLRDYLEVGARLTGRGGATLGQQAAARALDSEPTFRPGSVADQVARAMPASPNTAPHMETLHYVLETVEAIEVGLAIFGPVFGIEFVGALGPAGLLGALGLTIEVVGPIAGVAAMFLALGLPYAEVVNEKLNEATRNGFSLGLVVGADDRPLAYLNEQNLIQRNPGRNDFLTPAYMRKIQQAFNQALIAGYTQGRALLEHPNWRSAFFDDLTQHTLLPGDDDNKNWTPSEYRDLYYRLARTFRTYHLEGSDD